MKRKMIIIICALLSLISCRWQFDHDDMGERYGYMNGEIRRYNGPWQGSVRPCETIIAYQVLNYTYDERYIIAYSIFDENNPERYSKLQYVQEQHKRDSLLNLYNQEKRIHDCYWVIRIEDDKVIGPMTKSDFQKLCDNWEIKLKLDPKYEQEYRPYSPEVLETYGIQKDTILIDNDSIIFID